MIHVHTKYLIPAPRRYECLTWKTKERKENDVEIIISGSRGQEIAAELRSALKKIERKRELSYYITIRK